MTSKIETKCNSYLCPRNKYCANFSTDKSNNLVEFEFEFIPATESDEVDVFQCDNFEDKIEEEFYK